MVEVRLPLSTKIFIGNVATVVASLALGVGLERQLDQERGWVLLLAVLLPASVAAWLISRRLTRDLGVLSDAARSIGDGDLAGGEPHSRASVWPDETDVLARSTARMVENLRELVGRVQDTAARVKAASDALLDHTRAVGERAEGVLEEVGRIAERAAEQTVQAERQDGAISVVSDGLRRVTDIAAEAAEATRDTTAAATRGSERTRQAVQRIRAAFERAEDAGNDAVQLSERTAEIHDIVGAIGQIAEKTHLLSVNASIEAARAGEAGRGFGVVAEEIRRLAESSARAAERIREIVGGVDEQGRRVVGIMRASTEELSQSRTHLDEISGSLDDIARAAQQEAELVAALSGITREQLARVDDVVGASAGVRRGADRIAEATRAVESASSAQRERSRALDEAARALTALAAELDQVAGRFRL